MPSAGWVWMAGIPLNRPNILLLPPLGHHIQQVQRRPHSSQRRGHPRCRQASFATRWQDYHSRQGLHVGVPQDLRGAGCPMHPRTPIAQRTGLKLLPFIEGNSRHLFQIVQYSKSYNFPIFIWFSNRIVYKPKNAWQFTSKWKQQADP